MNTKPEFIISYFPWVARKDKNGLIPVYLTSKQNSKTQILYNTNVKVLKSALKDKGKDKKKGRYEIKNKPARLIEIEVHVKAAYRELFAQGQAPTLNDITPENFKTVKPVGNKVMAWCDDYIAGAYSDGMKKAVRTLKGNIKAFDAHLSFDQITKPKLKAFFAHLTKKNVANNSQYKRLRAFVNVASHANVDCLALTQYEMPYSTLNAIKVRLSWPEVKKVMETETKSQIEATAKDVFLMACFSGLRISDLLTLNKGQLYDYHYERIQTKTKQPVLVTLHKLNADLFNRYIASGIPYSRQKLSKALKEVLKRSGMTEPVTKMQQVGYSHTEKSKEKYEEVAFHSGRRFYARLLNDLGLGNEIARDELGHGFRSVTELYSGSPDHVNRVARVRKAIEAMDKTLEELALMKVA